MCHYSQSSLQMSPYLGHVCKREQSYPNINLYNREAMKHTTAYDRGTRYAENLTIYATNMVSARVLAGCCSSTTNHQIRPTQSASSSTMQGYHHVTSRSVTAGAARVIICRLRWTISTNILRKSTSLLYHGLFRTRLPYVSGWAWPIFGLILFVSSKMTTKAKQLRSKEWNRSSRAQP